MVDDLFEMSKINAGAVVPAFDKVALDEVVDDVLAAHRIAAERAGVLLKAELPDEPVRVVGSDRALVRVLSNLVANAIAHTPEGGKVELALGSDENGRGPASTTPASASTRPTYRGCSTWPTAAPTTGCRGPIRRCPAVPAWVWPSPPGWCRRIGARCRRTTSTPARGSRCGCRWPHYQERHARPRWPHRGGQFGRGYCGCHRGCHAPVGHFNSWLPRSRHDPGPEHQRRDHARHQHLAEAPPAP